MLDSSENAFTVVVYLELVDLSTAGSEANHHNNLRCLRQWNPKMHTAKP